MRYIRFPPRIYPTERLDNVNGEGPNVNFCEFQIFLSYNIRL